MVCALFEARNSGKGQVIDAAMIDGSAALMAMIFGLRASGFWTDERGVNLLDSGAHFYDTYETADGKYISVGSIEPQFYELLLKHTQIDDPDFQNQMDPKKWPGFKETLTAVFKSKTRDEWTDIMGETDICFAPVLSLDEAPGHPQSQARKTFVDLEGVTQPAPAPRFSRTCPEIKNPPPIPGGDTDSVLEELGFSPDRIEAFKKAEAI
jgi:alpha-methylacyl-CoA racemase